jgi:serine/threonine protein kinase
MTPAVGQKVGPYELLGKLGRGGMGVVYRAWDDRLHREVAVKMLYADYPMSGSRARFLQEARAASSLNHPNICTIFDIGEQDGAPYLVMELLQGETLKSRIDLKAFTSDEMVQISQEVSDALAVAHARGIIHRDIKPANIFLVEKPTGGRQAKVLDFGLAKIDRPVRGEHAPRHETSDGAAVGTVAYMSPEQARGEPLDGRSDLFSLGVVLYEMATRHVPFRGATTALTYVQLLNAEPDPVREWNIAVPKDLEKIIHKLLEKDPAARFQSAADLSAALDKLVNRNNSGWIRRATQAAIPLVRAEDPVARERRPVRRFSIRPESASDLPPMERSSRPFPDRFLDRPSAFSSASGAPSVIRPVARVPSAFDSSTPIKTPISTLSAAVSAVPQIRTPVPPPIEPAAPEAISEPAITQAPIPEPAATEPILPEPTFVSPEPVFPETLSTEPALPEPAFSAPVALEPVAPEPVPPEPVSPKPTYELPARFRSNGSGSHSPSSKSGFSSGSINRARFLQAAGLDLPPRLFKSDSRAPVSEPEATPEPTDLLPILPMLPMLEQEPSSPAEEPIALAEISETETPEAEISEAASPAAEPGSLPEPIAAAEPVGIAEIDPDAQPEPYTYPLPDEPIQPSASASHAIAYSPEPEIPEEAPPPPPPISRSFSSRRLFVQPEPEPIVIQQEEPPIESKLISPDSHAQGDLMSILRNTPTPPPAPEIQEKIRGKARRERPIPIGGSGSRPSQRRSLSLNLNDTGPETELRLVAQTDRDEELRRRRRKVAIVAAVLFAVACTWLATHTKLFRSPLLKQNDRVLLTPIDNKTGDTTLDDAVAQGLEIDLTQTPWLDLRGLDAYQSTLTPRASLTPASARKAAQALKTKAYLTGTLRSSGDSFTLAVDLIDTATNRGLAHVQQTAPSRDQLPSAIDRAVQDLRTVAGEPQESLAHTVPLALEATAKLDALHSYSQCRTAAHDNRIADALAACQQAVAIDGRFVEAQMQLAWLYRGQHAERPAADSARLAEGASAVSSTHTALLIHYTYELNANGDLPKATELIRKYVALFPNDPQGAEDLARVLRLQGQAAEASTAAQVGLAFAPNSPGLNTEAELALIGLDRYEDALALVTKEAQLSILQQDAALAPAYLASDPDALANAIERVTRPPRSLPSMVAYGLYLDNSGQLDAGALLWRTAGAPIGVVVPAKQPAGENPNAALAIGIQGITQGWLLAQGALDRALAGECFTALDLARLAESTAQGMTGTFNAGLSAALCGDKDLAARAIASLDRNFPNATAAKGYYIPDLRAAVALNKNDPALALQILKAAEPYDAVSLTPYLRGLAHLAAHQPQTSVADFQAVLKNRGLAFLASSNVYPMAQIQRARAYAAAKDSANSVQAYRAFLELWYGAEPSQPLKLEAVAAIARK